MKPGDLVFISATYYNPKGAYIKLMQINVRLSSCYFLAKKQRHDIVHVEIWVGDGEKTLGARWQKGVYEHSMLRLSSQLILCTLFNRVEIHDSYKFVSKSYHSMKFHFRSIDTWLAGECQRFVFHMLLM